MTANINISLSHITLVNVITSIENDREKRRERLHFHNGTRWLSFVYILRPEVIKSTYLLDTLGNTVPEKSHIICRI